MTLGELIKGLSEADMNHVAHIGFSDSAHSYRGIYRDIAFEPARNVRVTDMLAYARAALGKTYEGYKGGEYVMSEHVDVYLAHYGCCGEELGSILLSYMVGRP